MELALNRKGDKLTLIDDPHFYESFNFRAVLAIYPGYTDEKKPEFFAYCAEGGHIYSTSLTGEQIKDAINGDLALMGNLQRQVFYISTQDSGYSSKISEKDFRNYYCARVSKITPPGVYVNSNDFNGELLNL